MIASRLLRSGWPRFAFRHPRQLWKRLRLGRADFSSAPWDLIVAHAGDSPVILEAGAADGADTHRLAGLMPGAVIYALEPVPAAFQVLKSRVEGLERVTPLEMALTDGPTEVELHIATDTRSGSADSSSLLTPSEHLQQFPSVSFGQTRTVRGSTIDGLIASEGLECPTFLWLDLQGMELPVIESSPVTCRNLTSIYMEVSRVPLYHGMHLYDEVVRRMQALGFSIVEDRVGPVSGNVLFVR